MDYPKLNEKLLDCVLKFLKEHPKNYYQNDWCVVQGSAQDRETCKRVAAIKQGRKLGKDPDEGYESDTN